MSATIIINFIVFAGLVLLLISEVTAFARKSKNLKDVLVGGGNITALINKHLLSIVVLNTIVIISTALNENKSLWFLPAGDYDWLIIWIISILSAFLTGSFAAKAAIADSDKFTSITIPSYSSANAYFLTRALFLVIYEFFFRGIMLDNMVLFVGIPWAIVLNIFFYAAAHLFSGRKEIMGSVPFGLLLCLITIKMQSVWPAVIIHLVLSFAYEIKIIHYYSRSTKKIKV